jgi:phosphoribosylamine--glycine ligase
MKVLVVGSGGREHTIVWKLAQSEKVSKLYCAPGNGGISDIATLVDIKATNIEKMITFCKSEAIDLVFVAPDDPLALGMVDEMEKHNIRVFGPRKNAAIIEASKSFSKQLMKDNNIPTATYEVFSDFKKAKAYLQTQKMPIVIKADGLALGKGVIIATTLEKAIKACHDMLSNKKYGTSGETIVIEEFMVGREITVLAFTDGKTVSTMPSSQDHKRAYDNDQGLNTGGMGAFSPSPIYTDQVDDYCKKNIFEPTIKAMADMGRPFKGVIYFGLMMTEEGPKVVEYNARFGDPETQTLLPLLKTDLVGIINAVIDEKLHEINIEWDDKACVCIVLASGGYPVAYQKGMEITGIDKAIKETDVIVFHAGTKKENSILYTNGGRVLGVTAIDDTLQGATTKAYEGVNAISFKDMHYRKDIGKK